MFLYDIGCTVTVYIVQLSLVQRVHVDILNLLAIGLEETQTPFVGKMTRRSEQLHPIRRDGNIIVMYHT